MLRQAKVAVSFVLVAFSLMMEGTLDATLLQTTSRYGRRAKTSDAVSNSRRLVGL
jgi:hypothetical protein